MNESVKPEYRLIGGRSLPREAGPVVEVQGSEHEGEVYGPGCMFWCPCLERRVVVRTPRHTIAFDQDRRLTLDGSVGGSGRWKGDNLCHFWMKGGEVEMCDDAKCPGSSP